MPMLLNTSQDNIGGKVSLESIYNPSCSKKHGQFIKPQSTLQLTELCKWNNHADGETEEGKSRKVGVKLRHTHSTELPRCQTKDENRILFS